MLRGRSSNRMGVWVGFLLMAAAPGLAGAATLELVSETDTVADTFSTSDQPALSADGRYLVFLSDAADLVAGVEDDNNARDVFLHDRVLGTTTLVSHAAGAPVHGELHPAAQHKWDADDSPLRPEPRNGPRGRGGERV